MLKLSAIAEEDISVTHPFITRVYLDPVPIANSDFRKSRAGLRRLIKNATQVQRVKLLLIKTDMDHLSLTCVDYNK